MELLEERDGRPKGCAIVEFKTRDDAEKCVKGLHRYEFNGRALGVKEIRVSLTHSLFLLRRRKSTKIVHFCKISSFHIVWLENC